jgi:hypothetical protein
MLTGRDAKNYRTTISNVTVDELAKYIHVDLINQLEDDFGEPLPMDTILLYYRSVNKIKQVKAKCNNNIEENVTTEIIPTEEVVTETKIKKTRQPKPKV